MDESAFTLGELTILALATPFAPIVAWVLSDTFDTIAGWFLDAPDLEDTK